MSRPVGDEGSIELISIVKYELILTGCIDRVRLELLIIYRSSLRSRFHRISRRFSLFSPVIVI